MINVVAALIEQNNRVLIAQRATGDQNVLGKWEFPGGKVKSNESDEIALRREISEELELDIKVGDFIANSIYNYPTKTINLKLYKCELLSDHIKLHDHSNFIFVDKRKILEYDLCPADISLASIVKELK